MIARLSGLSCSDNRTLNFFTVDYNSQIGLARNLGLDDQAVRVLIVSPSRESYYVMNDEFSLENLSKFIENFHRQPDLLEVAKLSSGRLSAKSDGANSGENFVRDNSTESTLDGLSRDTFMSLDRSRPLLLLYVAPSCGFCSAAVRAFHSVQKFLSLPKTTSPVIQFSTINTSTNDLPWSFTAFTTPAVIYIPAGTAFLPLLLSPGAKLKNTKHRRSNFFVVLACH